MIDNLNFEHKLLTQEEEAALFENIDDPNNQDMLVMSNVRLVASVAKKYTNRGVPTEDLMQEGFVGLLKAIKRFDISKGFKFSTYAVWWIISAIEGCVTASRSVKLPVHIKDHIDRVYKASIILEKKFGREASQEEIATILNLEGPILDDIIKIIGKHPEMVEKCLNKEDDSYEKLENIVLKHFPNLSTFQSSGAVRAYIRVVRKNPEVLPEDVMKIVNVDVETIHRIMVLNQTVSLDYQIGDSRADTMSEIITDEIDSAEDVFIEDEDTSIMIKCLKESNTPKRDIEIVVSRYGLLDGRPKTLIEIGEEFDISKERARQIETRVLSTPAFILALHKNGVINGEKVKLVLNNDSRKTVKNEAFDPVKMLSEMEKLSLSAKESLVLAMRFNLKDDGECKTLKQISEHVGLSIQRVRQIEIAALKKGNLLDMAYAQNLIKPNKYERIKRTV